MTGTGSAIYVGAVGLEDATLSAVVDRALRQAKVSPGPDTPLYCEVIKRGQVTFVINHTDQPTTVTLQSGSHAIIGQLDGKAVRVNGHDVAIVRD